jgi:V/A-type H+-transporting ATPase subunit I
MRLREALSVEAMTRVAVVSRTPALRDALVRVADAGTVEVERPVSSADLPVSEAHRSLQRLAPGGAPAAALASTEPNIGELERDGRVELLAGEAQLAEVRAQAIVHGDVAAVVGWMPRAQLPRLAASLAEVGAAAAPLRPPKGVDPPTAGTHGPARRSFAPLVETYGTIPYADVDPTILAGISYAVMFGAMFGDVGHGALLVALALVVRSGRVRRLARLRPHWLVVCALGVSSTLFGFVYGEAFGPTGLVPPGLIKPIEEPVAMLVFGVSLGGVLLAGAYVLGIINRLREGGWPLALYAPAGVAGALVFVGAGLAVGAFYWRSGWAGLAAALLAVIGIALAFVGLFIHAGGGGAGAAQASIETFDLVVRLGANIVSFARLAAFGLTHAVLALIVGRATTGLWDLGPIGAVGAVLAFTIGNALAFGLEALVAGVQALRLEYYELFSRVLAGQGRPFRPWHVPMERSSTQQPLTEPAAGPR